MAAAGLKAKFRYSAALPMAAFVALCGAVPLTATRWYLLFILLVPLVVLIWGLRAGVDVRDGELLVRWAVGHRRIDAASIAGFAITHRAVRAVLADGRAVWLPSVPGTRVPVLAEAVGLHLATDHPATDGAAADPAAADGTANIADESPAAGDASAHRAR